MSKPRTLTYTHTHCHTHTHTCNQTRDWSTKKGTCLCKTSFSMTSFMRAHVLFLVGEDFGTLGTGFTVFFFTSFWTGGMVRNVSMVNTTVGIA